MFNNVYTHSFYMELIMVLGELSQFYTLFRGIQRLTLKYYIKVDRYPNCSQNEYIKGIF